MAVLTARVLVFQCLLAAFEACGKKTKLDVLRKIWLFTQVDLRILERPGYFDLFSELTTLLCYMPAYNTIDCYASDMLRACNVFLKSLMPGCRYLPFFAVVDEAQTAAEAFPYAFRGTPDSHEVDENGGNFRNEVPRRPALRQLLRLWEEMLHLIVTGTSLNLKYITESVSSSIAKDSARAIKVQDTGSHVNKEDQINRYLEYYLPPGHLNTPTGKELLQRARYWLVGRQVLFRPDRALPRFVASYVQNLVANKFQCCHKLLTKYILDITNFEPRDGRHWEELEGSLPEDLTDSPGPFDFGRGKLFYLPIKQLFDLELTAEQFGNSLLETVDKLVNYRLISGSLLFDEEPVVPINLVKCGFARFRDL
ncbi:hypothetical protein H0H92_002576 [Tricholoma furcatifolium]|nr:hypothetical protein H0H92_002576 [Tricholoma furcatifolium]